MPQTFRDLIAENKRNSIYLVLGFFTFVVGVAMVLTLGIVAWNSPRTIRHLDLDQLLLVGSIAGIISLVISLIAYYSGADMVLAVSGARPIQHKDDPELFNVVEEMAIAAGIPPPAVYVMDDEALNAFATGRDPEHAAVCITTGLRAKLTRDELQGVIAHEISHIRNYDIRLMLLTAVLVGAVAMLADLFWQLAFSTYPGRSSSSDDRDDGKDKGGGGILVVVIIVLALILAIIAPFIAQLIQLAVSRQREYLADASGVELTRYPQGLASALRKISDDPHVLRSANAGTAHLFIDNPLKKFNDQAHTMWASHPPIADRIGRLMALLHTPLNEPIEEHNHPAEAPPQAVEIPPPENSTPTDLA